MYRKRGRKPRNYVFSLTLVYLFVIKMIFKICDFKLSPSYYSCFSTRSTIPLDDIRNTSKQGKDINVYALAKNVTHWPQLFVF